MENKAKMRISSVVALLGVCLLVGGCKSAPPLTQSQAQAMIQAKYDQRPAAGIDITLGNAGMAQGAIDGYWARTKRYPNGYWADFTLTPEGKKVLKLATGGDVIQWRPASPEDKEFSVIVTTLVKNHMTVSNVGPVQDQGGGGKTVQFSEDENLSGLPGPVQDLAHEPGNQLSTQREADFALVNGGWQLQSIE